MERLLLNNYTGLNQQVPALVTLVEVIKLPMAFSMWRPLNQLGEGYFSPAEQEAAKALGWVATRDMGRPTVVKEVLKDPNLLLNPSKSIP